VGYCSPIIFFFLIAQGLSKRSEDVGAFLFPAFLPLGIPNYERDDDLLSPSSPRDQDYETIVLSLFTG